MVVVVVPLPYPLFSQGGLGSRIRRVWIDADLLEKGHWLQRTHHVRLARIATPNAVLLARSDNGAGFRHRRRAVVASEQSLERWERLHHQSLYLELGDHLIALALQFVQAIAARVLTASAASEQAPRERELAIVQPRVVRTAPFEPAVRRCVACGMVTRRPARPLTAGAHWADRSATRRSGKGR